MYAVEIAGLVVLAAVFLTAAYAGVRAAPWVPTRRADVQRALRLAALRPGETFVDLGCGDGRGLVTAAEQFGAQAVGYEISLLPFVWACFRRWRSPRRRDISVRFRDLFAADLSRADVVFLFLMPKAAERLKTKIVHEMRPGSRLVASYFPVPGLPATEDRTQDGTGAPLFLTRIDARP